MVILRCTQKLLKALDVRPTDAQVESTNVLGEWYANLIGTVAGGLVVFANARTLLSVAVPTYILQQLIPVFTIRVYNLLRVIGVPEQAARREVAEYDKVLFAKTGDRSILGSLNDIAHYYQYVAENWEADKSLSLQSAEKTLSRYIHKPLGYHYPCEIAIDLLTSPDPGPSL